MSTIKENNVGWRHQPYIFNFKKEEEEIVLLEYFTKRECVYIYMYV